MEDILYQRPREKLHDQGVKALTLIELLQIILGPGSSKITGATLARYVEELIKKHNLSYQTLLATPGIGKAKACQVLASIELSKRISRDE